jgi:hypothetical protein
LQSKIDFYPGDFLGYLLYPRYVFGIANDYKMTQTCLAGYFYLMFEQWFPEEIQEELVFSDGKHPLATAAAEKYRFHLLASTKL